LVGEEDPLDLGRELERHSQGLRSEVLREPAVRFQGQLQFLVGVAGDEGRVQFDWEHVEVALKLVLQGYALAQRREEGQGPLLVEFLLIDTLMELTQVNRLPPHSCSSSWDGLVHGAALILVLHEAIVEEALDVPLPEGVHLPDAEVIVQKDPQIQPLVDVVLYQDHPTYFDVDCEAADVEDCVDLLLDLHEHVVGVLLDRLLRVLLTD